MLQKKLRLKESRGEGGKTLNGSYNSFDDEDEESIRRIARQFEEKYVSTLLGISNEFQYFIYQITYYYDY